MLNKIGVIGAGQMGSGIAHVCALAEHDVVIVDIDAAALEKSLDRIDANRYLAGAAEPAQSEVATVSRRFWWLRLNRHNPSAPSPAGMISSQVARR